MAEVSRVVGNSDVAVSLASFVDLSEIAGSFIAAPRVLTFGCFPSGVPHTREMLSWQRAAQTQRHSRVWTVPGMYVLQVELLRLRVPRPSRTECLNDHSVGDSSGV